MTEEQGRAIVTRAATVCALVIYRGVRLFAKGQLKHVGPDWFIADATADGGLIPVRLDEVSYTVAGLFGVKE